nr:heme-binding protein [Bacteroidia bacterium]
ANLPKPNNAEVIIETVPEEYIAAITFGGFASDADMKKYSDLLEKALKKADLKHDGNFRFLGYNPPFQLVDRTNEIIVRVEWVPLEQ